MALGVLADLPALPLHEAGKYVAGAYVVVFALVLLYVAIMAVRLSRVERQLGELLGSERAGEPGPRRGEQTDAEEVGR
jgi:CcmD family protein